MGKVRKVGRNYVARCPSCAEAGHDRSGDTWRSELMIRGFTSAGRGGSGQGSEPAVAGEKKARQGRLLRSSGAIGLLRRVGSQAREL